MFVAQLYGKSRLIEERKERTDRGCMAAIDAMITAVHRGDHGTGDFRVVADRVNDLGLFEELLFDSETFPYPMKTRT